jgi:hypothetical protein
VAELVEELAMRDMWAWGSSGSSSGAGHGAGRAPPNGQEAAVMVSGADAAMVAAARERYSAYSREQRAAVRVTVECFLRSGRGAAEGETDTGHADEAGSGALAALEIDSIRRLREVLYACKVIREAVYCFSMPASYTMAHIRG